MPTLDWNAQVWDGSYDWSRAGEEWSGAWGSSAAQWYGTVLPRIYRWLPKEGTILEIAPGFGRWTNFLRHHCASLIGVDMAGKCVEACRVRFAGDPRTVFHQNDGQSLSMVPDGTIDFCFSFDSLVHAPIEAVSSYIVQLSTKLSPHGVAILHHSNSAEYVNHPDAQAHSRDKSTSGELVALAVHAANLAIICQEYLPWGGGDCYLDCITTFTRPGSRYDSGPLVERSTTHPHEAVVAASINRLYGVRG